MKARGDLRIWMTRLLEARDLDTAAAARDGLVGAAQEVTQEIGKGELPESNKAEIPANALPMGLSGFPISSWPDKALNHLNHLLPWAAISVDEQGRSLGLSWSATKRSKTQLLAEARHIALNAVYPFAGKHIMEMGCFEGLHTISCTALGARVTAIDSRMENLVKTVVRTWAYGIKPDVMLWDLEEDIPAHIPEQWDMLHHIGVLYHLADPVGHLKQVLKRTGEAMLLDTHIARDDADADADKSYEVDGVTYPYFHYGEVNISPFAGVLDHAKWLRLQDLMQLIADQGFSDVRLIDDRAERNGRRVTIWAFREKR